MYEVFLTVANLYETFFSPFSMKILEILKHP